MENKSNNKAIWIFGAVLLILVLIIFIPGLVKGYEIFRVIFTDNT